MPDLPLSLTDFSRRLVLAGGRSSIPPNAMRRCVACAPEPEPQVKSRYGSATRYAIPNVIGITSGFSGSDHILYDGSKLYKNTTQIAAGYNGQRVTFVKGPPATGIQNYLFVAGGGKLTKIDPSGNATNWGIDKPPNKMTASVQPAFQTVIDPFDNSASQWFHRNCTLTDQPDSAFPSWDGVSSFQLETATVGQEWRITKVLPVGAPLNLGRYSVGGVGDVPSLETDLISLYINVHNPANLVWINILFDVNDGSFQHDWYNATVQLVSQTNNFHAATPAVIMTLSGDQWTQIAIAKSQFTRHGSNLEFDWTTVKAIRINGGNPNAADLFVHLSQFTMYGGMPLGTGPAALQNGSELQYLVTFGNSTTGNDSNPNDTPLPVQNVALQAVQLSNIPISNDPQVGNRKLWRTSEGGALFFYLDTIYDNTTTSYLDNTSTIGGPIITTPWQASAIITAPGYLIDGGNGYFFELNGPAKTGTVHPTWNTPSAIWSALSVFDQLNQTVLPPLRLGVTSTLIPPNAFKVVQTGTTGATQPNWKAVTVGNQIVDGTVIWQNIGPLTTPDGTGMWFCLGVNSLPTLGSQEVLYDNAVFPSTIGDAVFFEGSMLTSRDSASGAGNYVYISPPGRAEGFGNQLRVGSAGDPIQKLIVWNEQVFVITTRYIYPLNGIPPNMAVGDLVVGAEGTSWPFTVTDTPIGIAYRSSSGLRIFDGSSNYLLGYAAISPIESGATVENVNPFLPTIGAHVRNEVYFSDGVVTFAYHLLSTTWRMLGLGMNAIYYNDELDLIEAARQPAVVDYETLGTFSDDGLPISVEWQTASVQPDTTQQLLVKRVYLDCDLAGQVMTPTLLVDGNDFAMPAVTNVRRGTIEIPFQKTGRIVGVRLTGNVLARVSLFGVWADHRIGQ